MKLKEIVFKAQKRLWSEIVEYSKPKPYYFWLYRSYWEYRLLNNASKLNNGTNYFAAMPNRGAGIGHQLANWIAGYWYAKQFGLNFAHIPFSTEKWEIFLGFGEGEKTVVELLKDGYVIRKLPLFNEDDQASVDLVREIIQSNNYRKVLFLAEQDQGYKDQFGIIAELKDKFNNSNARKNDKIIYDSSHFNIAVHVRRTVIIDGKVIIENEAAQSLRWLSNDYYEKVLIQVLDTIRMKNLVSKPIDIYIFSTGKAEEFSEFSKYGNVHFCSDMDEYASFLHLIRADLLITSKSSFSYKPALMNQAIKVCPRNFWHSYPQEKSWIMVENDGSFENSKLQEALM